MHVFAFENSWKKSFGSHLHQRIVSRSNDVRSSYIQGWVDESQVSLFPSAHWTSNCIFVWRRFTSLGFQTHTPWATLTSTEGESCGNIFTGNNLRQNPAKITDLRNYYRITDFSIFKMPMEPSLHKELYSSPKILELLDRQELEILTSKLVQLSAFISIKTFGT